MNAERKRKVNNEWKNINRYNNRTFKGYLTGYEMEIRELCKEIRKAETIESSMRLYFNYQYYISKQWKI
jgi:hypothetical protein